MISTAFSNAENKGTPLVYSIDKDLVNRDVINHF